MKPTDEPWGTRLERGAVVAQRYEVLALLGRGGMGEVYKALDRELDREVALKLIRRDALDDHHIVRLLDEARAMASISHPCFPTIHDVKAHEDGSPFLVMELLAGESLKDRSRKEPLLPHHAALLLHPLAGALHALHDKGMVHRDVKPQNILVTPAGVKLTDFGLAHDREAPTRITLEGAPLGTVAYMAPEQTESDERPDPRSDLYAFGATLYDAVAGRAPFQGPDTHLLEMVRRAKPRPLRELDRKVPKRFDRIVMRCLEKDPRKRYQTALKLEEDLEHFLAGERLEGEKKSWWRD